MSKRKVIINNSSEILTDASAKERFLIEEAKKGEMLLSTNEANEAIYGYKGGGESVKFISEKAIDEKYAKKTDIKESSQSDWNETDESSASYIQNKPALGTAAEKNVPDGGNASDEQVVMGNDTRLMSKDEKDKLNGIEDGAQKNVKPDWSKDESDASGILNKPELGTASAKNIPVNGDASADEVVMGNDSRLFTAEERTKLEGIEAGAQVNVKPDWNAAKGDKAEILNKPSIPSKASEIAFDGEHAYSGLTGEDVKTSIIDIEQAITDNEATTSAAINDLNNDITDLKNAKYDGEVIVDQTIGDAEGSVSITNNEGEKHFKFTFSGIKGEKGQDGVIGKDGKSAYEIAKENGATGATEEEWIASLKGEKGDDGKSAYEVAQEKGYTGTTEEWLASLKGEKGDTGDAAGFGEISATLVDPTADEPKVVVGTTGGNTAKSITFTFSGLKGDPGTGITVKASKADCTKIGDTYIDEDGNLQLLESFNESEPVFRDCGKIKGPDGKDGRGIASVTSSESTEDDGFSTYTFSYTDDSAPLTIKVKNGSKGSTGEVGASFVPSVSDEGELSWTKVNNPQDEPATKSIRGPQGERGYHFTPSVSESGLLEWSNNGGLENPTAVNIKGSDGKDGVAAGFGNPEASVDGTTGTPSVKVTSSGPSTAKVFDFSFSGLKGEKGEQGIAAGFGTPEASVDGTTGTPSVKITATGEDIAKVFKFEFSGLKGEKGEQGTGINVKASKEECTKDGDAYIDNGYQSDTYGHILIYNSSTGTFTDGGTVKGPDGVGISSITYIQNDADGGYNTIQFNYTNNESSKVFKIKNGSTGDQGDKGDVYIPVITETEGHKKYLSWERKSSGDTATTDSIRIDPIYFRPSVDSEGTLSWSCNDNTYILPEDQNIKGTDGKDGRGIASVDSSVSTEDGGTSTYTFNYTDNSDPLVISVKNGDKGSKGDNGSSFVPSVSDEGELSWTKTDNPQTMPETKSIRGPQGDRGYYFTPSVSESGDLSWTNDGGLANPSTVNIKGPQGESGEDGISIGKLTATVNNSTGTPSVSVAESQTNNIKDFRFSFNNLKGETGKGISKIGYTSSDADGGDNAFTVTYTDNTTDGPYTIKNGKKGTDGATPTIGENGNWFINGEDTGKPSQGSGNGLEITGIATKYTILDDGTSLTYDSENKKLVFTKKFQYEDPRSFQYVALLNPDNDTFTIYEHKVTTNGYGEYIWDTMDVSLPTFHNAIKESLFTANYVYPIIGYIEQSTQSKVRDSYVEYQLYDAQLTGDIDYFKFYRITDDNIEIVTASFNNSTGGNISCSLETKAIGGGSSIENYVESLGGTTGAIDIDSGNTTNGSVQFSIDNNTLSGTVNGLGSAAYLEISNYVESLGGKSGIINIDTTSPEQHDENNYGHVTFSIADESDSNKEGQSILSAKVEGLGELAYLSKSDLPNATQIPMSENDTTTVSEKITEVENKIPDTSSITTSINSLLDKTIATDTTKAYLVGKTESGSTTLSNSTLKSTNEDVYTESGNLYAAGFYETSDETLKWFTGDIPVDFEALKSIPKQYFIWRNRETPTNIGTSAQKVQKVYPELVSESDGHLTVDYAKLSIIALKAIDVLNERIEELENEIKELKGK